MQDFEAVIATGAEEEKYMPAIPEDEDELLDEDEAYCSVTNKIVIVSPLPQRIHELVRGLSAACYDVMVFHQAEPDLLSRLQPELVIVDRTVLSGQGSLEWLEGPAAAILNVLQLVPNSRDSQPGAGPHIGSLVWPMPIPQLLTEVRNATATARRLDRSFVGHPPANEPSAELKLKDLTLDTKRHTVDHGTRRIDLTRTEFELLKVLMESGGTVLTRQELMDRVWGEDYFGGSNTVDVHVKALRQKLGDNPKSPTYIATVRGIGYRLAD
jgi:two-component system, OmpR family, alkaline phosphatase synthesis response regulator PhoP